MVVELSLFIVSLLDFHTTSEDLQADTSLSGLLCHPNGR